MFDHKKMMHDLIDKLHPEAVVHAFGGFLGSLTSGGSQNPTPISMNSFPGSGMSWLSGNPGNTPNPFSAKGGGGGGGSGTSSLTPSSSYNASTPGLTNATGAFNGDLNTGAAQEQQGVSGLNASAAGLNGTLQQQQGLANQLRMQAAGKGPNPAQLQEQQNVNANAQQAAGTIESTKGLNPALAAQMAARGQSAANQNAAGGAATLQAQQQLAAQQQLGQQQSAMASTQGEQGALYGQGASLGTGLANTGATGIGNYNNAVNTGTLGTNQINATTANDNAKLAAGTQAGIFNGIGGALGTLGTGTGFGALIGGGAGAENWDGIASGADYAGPASSAVPDAAQFAYNGGVIHRDTGGGVADNSGTMLQSIMKPADPATSAAPAAAPQASPVALAQGGQVPAKYDQQAIGLAQALMAQGGKVPGKDTVPGKNSPKNDTVPAVLSPGEVVLPLAVTKSNNPAAAAASFVEKLTAKAHPTYGHVLQARAHLAKAVAAHKCAGGPL